MKTDLNAEETILEYVMPNAEAVLMATLALMTGHAHNQNKQHVQWMAHKIEANLGLLSSHPDLSEDFKKALGRLVVHWSPPLWREQSTGTKGQMARYLPAAGTVQ